MYIKQRTSRHMKLKFLNFKDKELFKKQWRKSNSSNKTGGKIRLVSDFSITFEA